MGDEAAWEAEHQWLIDFMRHGAPMTTEAEHLHVTAAFDRWKAGVGEEDRDRFVVHEAGMPSSPMRSGGSSSTSSPNGGVAGPAR